MKAADAVTPGVGSSVVKNASTSRDDPDDLQVDRRPGEPLERAVAMDEAGQVLGLESGDRQPVAGLEIELVTRHLVDRHLVRGIGGRHAALEHQGPVDRVREAVVGAGVEADHDPVGGVDRVVHELAHRGHPRLVRQVDGDPVGRLVVGRDHRASRATVASRNRSRDEAVRWAPAKAARTTVPTTATSSARPRRARQRERISKRAMSPTASPNGAIRATVTVAVVTESPFGISPSTVTRST